jgi:hypothetical protein
VIAFLMGSTACALAQESPAGEASAALAPKEGYHLFRPTPRALLREMSTDRPDLTESPYTVDAGHAQIEVEAITVTRDRGQDRTGYMGFLAKLGVLGNVDLQAGFESIREDVDEGDLSDTSLAEDTGISNLTVRLKWNLWGNDGGSTALAAMPYVVFPTSEDQTQLAGGLIVPLAIGGPWETGLGTMAQVDIVPDADTDGHHVEWLFTGTVARDLFGNVAGFLEGTSGHPEGEWTALVNAGLTFAATPDLQLDAGTRLGVTDEAEGFALFLGISYRR